jgi:Ser/Thr protein kinase RdoA (MazF antagonist)
MTDPTPRFTPLDAERFGHDIFGLAAAASRLPSERDQNFVLTSAGGEKFVLKIAKSDEEKQVLDFQNAALERVAQRAPELLVSRPIPARDGTGIAEVRDDAGRSFFVRLVAWIEGELLVDLAPYDKALLGSLGVALARLDGALVGFRHAAMYRPLHWDLRHIAAALEHLPLLSPGQRSIVEHFRPAWEQVEWSCLRTGVIYNDANDHNVLVRDGRVIGFLDFGDMVHSALVCDPAIALAYVMLDQPDPIAAAIAVATAYHEQFSLEAAELHALYPLALSRLCMSVCYAARNARAKRGDPYQLVTAGPAWRLLPRLMEVPVKTACDRLREAAV